VKWKKRSNFLPTAGGLRGTGKARGGQVRQELRGHSPFWGWIKWTLSGYLSGGVAFQQGGDDSGNETGGGGWDGGRR